MKSPYTTAVIDAWIVLDVEGCPMESFLDEEPAIACVDISNNLPFCGDYMGPFTYIKGLVVFPHKEEGDEG